MPRSTPPTPTWWLLVELDLPGFAGQRAIGPLSWTDVRALGDRWERAFGAGTTAFTERPGPVPKRARVGPDPVAAPKYHTGAVPIVNPAPIGVEPKRVKPEPVKTAKPAPAPRIHRDKTTSVPTARRRASGPSRLTERARDAMARTRAARAAIDASIAGMEVTHV